MTARHEYTEAERLGLTYAAIIVEAKVRPDTLERGVRIGVELMLSALFNETCAYTDPRLRAAVALRRRYLGGGLGLPRKCWECGGKFPGYSTVRCGVCGETVCESCTTAHPLHASSDPDEEAPF